MLFSAVDRRHYFLLLRQKKVSKEKATLGRCRLRRFPALLRFRGGCATRASPSDSARPLSAKPCVARHLARGPQGVAAQALCFWLACCGRRRKKGESQNLVVEFLFFDFPFPGSGEKRFAASSDACGALMLRLRGFQVMSASGASGLAQFSVRSTARCQLPKSAARRVSGMAGSKRCSARQSAAISASSCQ